MFNISDAIQSPNEGEIKDVEGEAKVTNLFILIIKKNDLNNNKIILETEISQIDRIHYK